MTTDLGTTKQCESLIPFSDGDVGENVPVHCALGAALWPDSTVGQPTSLSSWGNGRSPINQADERPAHG